MIEKLEQCKICPHKCKVNRLYGKTGRCKSKDLVKIAAATIYNYEEPCISGKRGSGTVFFSNCNMNCVYCQNYEISQEGVGKEISIENLADIFLLQQKRGVENINLVTPTSYIIQIIEAIKIAKKNGLSIPIVYNTNGYENVESIKLLNGYIDIYLPDLKYSDDNLAKKYSGVDNYFEIATKAIQEMYSQVKNVNLNSDGVMQKGLIIRHLVLPGHLANSKKVLKWIEQNMSENIYVSVMAQFFPTYRAEKYSEINRKLTKEEYDEIEKYLFSLKLNNGYIQELGEHEEEYVPKWLINI